MAQIFGRVIDNRTNSPIQNATVTADGGEVGRHNIVTDADGNYRLDVPDGVYVIHVEHPNYATDRGAARYIQVTADTPAGINFVLNPRRIRTPRPPRPPGPAPPSGGGSPPPGPTIPQSFEVTTPAGRPAEITTPKGRPIETRVSGTGPGGEIPIKGEIDVGQKDGEPWEHKIKEVPPKKPEIDIIAEPREVIDGGRTTLKWKSKNADEVILYSDPRVFPDRPTIPSGEMRTPPLTSGIAPPPYDVSFMAVARGPGGEAADEVIVHVREKTEKEIIGDEIEKGKVEEYKQSKRIIKKGTPPKKWLAEDILGGKFTTGSLINVIILSVLLSLYYSFTIGRILGLVGLQQTGFLTVIGIIVILLLVFFSTRGKGWGGSIRFLLPFVGIYTLIFLIAIFNFSQLLDMEWYLARLDILKVVGVPEGTVDNVKAGIRNALSFLFKEKPAVEKPVAEKIGSWQALDVKFGSKYTEPSYSPKKVYANDTAYYLPVTIVNPNTVESGVSIEDFYIKSNDCKNDADCRNKIYEGSAAMDTTNRFKLMCGFSDSCTKGKECKIEPQTEKEILISFENKDCLTLKSISQSYYYEKREQCEGRCNSSGWTISYYNETTKNCVCKVKERTKNDFSELCLNRFNETIEMTSEVRPEFSASFPFSVEGNSEFKIAQKQADVKFLPKPKITTSTGPLGVTVYFVPSFYAQDKPLDSVKMFISITNKGGGSANIISNEIDITQPGNPQIKFDDNSIKTCVEEMKKRNIVINQGEEKEIPCTMKLTQGTITGTFATIPINVKMNYIYSQYYSQDIPIYRVFVDPRDTSKPESAYIGLPGYCSKDFKI